LSRRLKHAGYKADQKTRSYSNNQSKENIIDINNYRKPIKQKVILLPKNLAQEAYIDALDNPKVDIVFATGPAGTGKSYIATLYAIQQLKEHVINKIVITRPNIALDDRDIGFLPGDIYAKMAPWTRPILEIFEEYYSVKEIQAMIEENVIELLPMAFVRGRTLKNSIVIVDEGQNTTPNSMVSVLTRIGEGSKIIVTGDIDQSDRGQKNGLTDFLNRFESHDRIKVIEFTKNDVERHPVISTILKWYAKS
jgi:phosphate starvation-inducible PhoH-like protein